MPFVAVLGENLLQRAEDDLLLVGGRLVVERRGVVLGLEALVNQQRRIAAVIDDELRALAAGERERHGRAPPVLGQRLALPGEDRNTGRSDGRSGVVLRREDVARAPAHVGTQLDERLDENRRLDGHVQRTHHTNPLEGLQRAVFATHGHQTGHLVFRNLNLLTSPLGQRHVGHLVGNAQIQKHN